MRVRRVATLAVLFALGTLLAFGAGSAFATHVRCGDVITEDTTLDSDLLHCPSDGWNPDPEVAITIGADNVRLDLNGHTLSSDAESHGTSTTGVSTAYDHASVSNGTITGYEFPVHITGDHASITNVTVAGRFAARLSGSDIEFKKNTVFGGRRGIEVGGGPYLIEGNRVVYGLCAICPISDDDPIASSSIRNNVVTDGGIFMGLDSHSAIEHNVVADAGGIGAWGTGLVAHNHVERSGGIEAFESVTVAHNTANYNGNSGITAYDSVTVTHNTANYNRKFGIEAEPTVIDGGGNKAKGNGYPFRPLQCLNVFCK